MKKLKTWKNYKENISLTNFCKPKSKCPICDSILECQEEDENTIYVCSNCDYISNGGE